MRICPSPGMRIQNRQSSGRMVTSSESGGRVVCTRNPRGSMASTSWPMESPFPDPSQPSKRISTGILFS